MKKAEANTARRSRRKQTWRKRKHSLTKLKLQYEIKTGSIFAITRRKWAWSLLGAIAATLSFILPGIPVIILSSV